MANPVTASEARANLYRLFDETNESHRPVVIAGNYEVFKKERTVRVLRMWIHHE